jgi:hypothetical protein
MDVYSREPSKTKWQVAFDQCAELDNPALTNKMYTPVELR